MPWVKQAGRMVKVGVSPQEVTVASQVDVDEILVCPECGREYKTETGLENHLADKH